MLIFQECALNYSSERFSRRICLFELQKKEKHQQPLCLLIKADRHVPFLCYNALKRWWEWKTSEVPKKRVADTQFQTLQRHQLVMWILLLSPPSAQRHPVGCWWEPVGSIAPIFADSCASSYLFLLHFCWFRTYLRVWFTWRADAREGGGAASEVMHWMPINLLSPPFVTAYNQKVFRSGTFLCSFPAWEIEIIHSSLQDGVTSSQQFSFVFSCTPEKNVKRTGIIFHTNYTNYSATDKKNSTI